MSIARLKFLSEEIHDLIDVSYVLNLIVDQIEQKMDKSVCAINTVDNGPDGIGDRASSTDVMSSSKLYDNSHLIYDTYIVRPNELYPPYHESLIEANSQADSLDEFMRLEEHFEQNPESTGEELIRQTSVPIAADTGAVETEESDGTIIQVPVPAPRSPRKDPETELKTELHKLLNEQDDLKKKEDVMSKSLTEYSQVKKERNERGQSVGSQSLLMRLEHENEELTEQVEVLEKMNQRLAKKAQELEEKARVESDESKKINDMESQWKKQLQQLTTKVAEMEKSLKDKTEEIEKLECEKDRAEKECETMGANITQLQQQNEIIKTETDNSKVKIEELENHKKNMDRALEDQVALIRNNQSEIPDVSKVEVIKSYLHSEVEKRAVQLVEETFNQRKLHGDAATRYISASFGSMYGEHWQVFLFRENGHGCQIYHNNNCYILLRLASFLLVLFKH